MFLHAVLKLQCSLFPFLMQNGIDIIGEVNDSTLFTCRNLFGLFSRKAEICQTWKINGSYILSFSAKSC